MKHDLPAVPDTVYYVRALTAIEKDLSVHDRELLTVHWSFPHHAATAPELAHATGKNSYGAVNFRYGRLGILLRREMNYTAPGLKSSVFLWFRQHAGHWILHMHPQFAAALVQLGWVRGWQEQHVHDERAARLMTMDELREFVRLSQWTFAHTMPHIPHEYTLRAKAPDEKLFERVVLYIREAGYEGTFGSASYTYLDIDGWKYWTMGAPLGPTGMYDRNIHTILINRARLTPATPE